MTSTDPFAQDSSAYVMGMLDDADRRAFEVHLSTCPDCRARVEEVRATATLLGSLPRDAFAHLADTQDEPVPDTLLPSLLRQARTERARRRGLVGAVSSLAAAAVIALAVVAWPFGSSSANPVRAFTTVAPSPITATARLVSHAWGTEIDVHCAYTYPQWDNSRPSYQLVVFDKADAAHTAGDWSLVPGRDSLDFKGGTSVPLGQMSSVQIRTMSGVELLKLSV